MLYPLLEGDAAGSTDSAVLALTCRQEHRLVGMVHSAGSLVSSAHACSNSGVE